MAGPLTVAAAEHCRENAAVAVCSRWQVGFARFFRHPYPAASITLQHTVPLSTNQRRRSPHGTWLSSSSFTASVQIIGDASSSDAILVVEFHGKILEEHYTSNLNFSWPQMSCASGFPPRGSRAILISYKDSANEIQKFALRFLTSDEAGTFMATLKGNLKCAGEVGPQKKDIKLDISSISDFTSSNGVLPRASNLEDTNVVMPLESYAPEMPLGHEYEVEQSSYSPQTTHCHIPNEISNALPPSFGTLLSSCFSQANQDTGLKTVKEEADLKLQIMKYMEDSSFQEMLLKVDRVINEIGGGNWINP